MIIFGILKLLISLPASLLSDFTTIAEAPSFYFQWVSDVQPYFEVARYIIPLEQLIPLFLAIIAIIVIRVVIALIRMFFGKIIPLW